MDSLIYVNRIHW